MSIDWSFAYFFDWKKNNSNIVNKTLEFLIEIKIKSISCIYLINPGAKKELCGPHSNCSSVDINCNAAV